MLAADAELEVGSCTSSLALNVRWSGRAGEPIASLSGGNQQKIVLARWLERGSSVLLLAEPTRGVDVGAREEIYHALRELAAKGTAVVLATSDHEEVVQVADRCIVMAEQRVVAELVADDIRSNVLLRASGG